MTTSSDRNQKTKERRSCLHVRRSRSSFRIGPPIPTTTPRPTRARTASRGGHDPAVAAFPRVVPMLSYEDCGAAADWLCRAFGFEETDRYAEADGRVTHVELRLGDGVVFLGNPGPDYQSPRRHRE